METRPLATPALSIVAACLTLIATFFLTTGPALSAPSLGCSREVTWEREGSPHDDGDGAPIYTLTSGYQLELLFLPFSDDKPGVSRLDLRILNHSSEPASIGDLVLSVHAGGKELTPVRAEMSLCTTNPCPSEGAPTLAGLELPRQVLAPKSLNDVTLYFKRKDLAHAARATVAVTARARGTGEELFLNTVVPLRKYQMSYDCLLGRGHGKQPV